MSATGEDGPSVHCLDGPERAVVVYAFDRDSLPATWVRAWMSQARHNDAHIVVALIASASQESAARPPQGSGLWLRVFTQLHAHGYVDDSNFYADLGEALRSQRNTFAILAQLEHKLDRRISIVIDAMSSTERDVAQLRSDAMLLIKSTKQLRVVFLAPFEIAPDDSDGAEPVCWVTVTSPDQETATEGVAIGETELMTRPPQSGIDALDLAMRNFIRSTWQAPELDVRLARVLSGHPDAAALLERLSTRRLGEWRDNRGENRRFVYVETVKVWAHAQTDTYEGERDDPSLSTIISRWLLEKKIHPRSALHFASRSGEGALIASAAMRVFPFESAADIATIDTLAQLPRDAQLAHPLISLWTGLRLSLQPDGAARALEYLRAASMRRNGSELAVTERVILIGAQSYVNRRLGNASASRDQARDAARRSIRLMQESRVDDSLKHVFATIVHQVGVSLNYAGDTAGARTLMTHLYDYCDERDLRHRRNSAASVLAFIAAEAGTTIEAERWLSFVVKDDWPQRWSMGRTQSFYDLTELMIAVARADLARLDELIAPMSIDLAATEHWDVVIIARVCAELLRGDYAAATAWFDTHVDKNLAETTHPRIVLRLHMVKSMLVIAGQAPQAHLPRCREFAGEPISRALSAIIAARVGNSTSAIEDLVRASQRAKTPMAEAFALIASIVVAQHSDSTIDMSEVRAELSVLASGEGLIFPLSLLSEQDRAALKSPSSNATKHVPVLDRIFDMIPSLPSARDGGTTDVVALTKQEHAILIALSHMESRVEIASHLHISINTVKVHLRNLYRKLRARSRSEALIAASLRGLLVAESDSTP